MTDNRQLEGENFSDAIERILARRKELQSEIDEIDRTLGSFMVLARRIEGEIGKSGGSISHVSSSERTIGAALPLSEARTWTKAEVGSLAIEILKERGRPIPLANLFDDLVERGAVIGGLSPKSNLSAKLFQHGGFVSLKGWGWWLKSEPFEKAAYDPSSLSSEGCGKSDAEAPNSEGESVADVALS